MNCVGGVVAPYAGAWIEILHSGRPATLVSVAPYAGAWIEIICPHEVNLLHCVAPYAGAWIEICSTYIPVVLS